MRGEHTISNKIVPVKSLLQNAKTNVRKSSLQSVPKEAIPTYEGTINTPKNIKEKCQGLSNVFIVEQKERNRPSSFQKYYHSMNDLANEEFIQDTTPKTVRPEFTVPHLARSKAYEGSFLQDSYPLQGQDTSKNTKKLAISNDFVGSLQNVTELFKSTSFCAEPWSK